MKSCRWQDRTTEDTQNKVFKCNCGQGGISLSTPCLLTHWPVVTYLGSIPVPDHQWNWNQQCSQAAVPCTNSWEEKLLPDLPLRHQQAGKLEITNQSELCLSATAWGGTEIGYRRSQVLLSVSTFKQSDFSREMASKHTHGKADSLPTSVPLAKLMAEVWNKLLESR